MWTSILIYEPMHIISTFSWKKYYIYTKDLEAFKKAINTNKFITIKESVINTSSIDTIDKCSNDINQVENKLLDISNDNANKVREQVYLRKSEHKHKTLTDWVLENIINKFI